MAFNRVGYGQVEPNQLSAQKTGQIYASLPLDSTVSVLQNGEFMFYDKANGSVNSGKEAVANVSVKTYGEPMLVFNEIKLYEPFWRTSYKDFAMIRVGENYVTSTFATNGPGVGTPKYGDGATTVGVNPQFPHTEYPYRMDGFAPRLFKTNVGDVYTTNMVKDGNDVTYAVGDLLGLLETDRGTLQLEKVVTGNEAPTYISDIRFIVAKVYTMPDGQAGLQIQRVQ